MVLTTRPHSTRHIDINDASQFDVVLMDNHMPRMNGTAATEEMRRRGYAGVVIGITGDDDDVTRQEFLAAGANACLVKPISRDRLLACLAQHLDGGTAQGMAASGEVSM